MSTAKTAILLAGFLSLLVSCNKDIEPVQPVLPTVPVQYDTTTVEKMEFRWSNNGSFTNLAFTYYFSYDSLYRIKKSVMMDYANSLNPPQPDTAFYRQYFYTGNDSLPWKLIYQNFPGRPDNFFLDTSYYTYNIAGRLITDSGTTYNDIGYGIYSYYKRVRRYNYPAGDSMNMTDNRLTLAGYLFGSTASSSFSVKNSIAGNQAVQKFYRSNGTVSDIYTTRYDTGKNPLAKSLLQVIPYFNPNGHDIGDGNLTLHLPAAFNRVFFQRKLMPTAINSDEYNCTITYNAQNLPVEILVQPTQALLTTWQVKLYY
jgi:hypothetical protein